MWESFWTSQPLFNYHMTTVDRRVFYRFMAFRFTWDAASCTLSWTWSPFSWSLRPGHLRDRRCPVIFACLIRSDTVDVFCVLAIKHYHPRRSRRHIFSVVVPTSWNPRDWATLTLQAFIHFSKTGHWPQAAGYVGDVPIWYVFLLWVLMHVSPS